MNNKYYIGIDIGSIEKNGTAKTEAEAAARPVPKFEGSLNPDGGATP